MKREVIAYTDGGCRGNPGIGAWAAVLEDIRSGTKKEIGASCTETTNNRMELTGAIKALEALKTSCRVTIHSDSQYVIKGMTEWIKGWIKRGWKNASRKPVENRDLWETLLSLSQKHDVSWHWVKGHAGNEGNERCDLLLNELMDRHIASGREVSL